MTSTGVRIDPRIRDRRIEVKREAGRRRLRVLVAIMAVICALGLGYLAVTSPLLDVDTIRVSNTQHVTTADVLTAAKVKRHDAMVFVDTGAIAHRVESLPWVQHATVRRSFPGTVQIAVTEYAP